MIFRLIVLVISLTRATLALADQSADVGRCAAIASPADRLSCYDEVAQKLGVTGGNRVTIAEPTTGTGEWSVRTETSPIDDTSNVYLSLVSPDSVSSMLGTATPLLSLRCKEHKTELYIDWGVYLGLDETEILVRLDSQKATRANWSISTDNKATFYPVSPISFIRQLAVHKKLLAQTTPYGESPAMVSFDLAGLSQALKPLQAACGWK